MSQHSTKPIRIRFRSVRERTLDDQMVAMDRGYNSVLELAFDEMLEGLVQLQHRLERIEKDMGLSSFVAERYRDGIGIESDPED